jgi:hypothetical protein
MWANVFFIHLNKISEFKQVNTGNIIKNAPKNIQTMNDIFTISKI